MKRLLLVLFSAALVTSVHGEIKRIEPRVYLQHIKYLASDELEGRGDGAPGLEKAADYIEKSFRASGLEPAGDNGEGDVTLATSQVRPAPRSHPSIRRSRRRRR